MSAIINPFVAGGGGSSTATLVGADCATHGSSPAIPFPGAPQAGDVCVLIELNASNSDLPSGWTGGTGGAGSAFAYTHARKVLDASDISTGSVSMAVAGGTYAIAIYRGASGLPNYKNQAFDNLSTTGPLSIAGFTKHAQSKKVVAMMVATGNNPGALVQPGGFSIQDLDTFGFVSDVDSSGYTNGTNLDFDWGSGSKIAVAAFEII